MSTTCTSPANTLPGAQSRPGFQRPKLTVSAQGTAWPSTWPVSVATPVGRSMAATASPRPAAAASAATAWASGPRGAERWPVPSSASTARVAWPSSPSSAPGVGVYGQLQLVAQCPVGLCIGCARGDGRPQIHLPSPQVQPPGHDVPVTSVVPGPTQDGHASHGPARGDGIRSAPARELHERVPGYAEAIDDGGVLCAHCGGCGDGQHGALGLERWGTVSCAG